MGEQGSVKDVLRKNRRIFLAILLLPAVGISVAIPLIIVRSPQNLGLTLGLITALLMQYLITVFLIMRRLNRLV